MEEKEIKETFESTIAENVTGSSLCQPRERPSGTPPRVVVEVEFKGTKYTEIEIKECEIRNQNDRACLSCPWSGWCYDLRHSIEDAVYEGEEY